MQTRWGTDEMKGAGTKESGREGEAVHCARARRGVARFRWRVYAQAYVPFVPPRRVGIGDTMLAATYGTPRPFTRLH